MARWIALTLIACLAAASGAEAAPKRRAKRDTTPPVIEHAPLARHLGVPPLVVEAKIVDAESAVFEPTLLVRLAGTVPYTRIAMTAKPGVENVFAAEIPGALLVGDVEYLVEAFDDNGNGPSRVGEEEAPLKVLRDVPVQEQKPPPPPPPPPPGGGVVEDDGASPVLIGVGIAAGVVVVAGLVAGVGFAVYALRAPAPAEITLQVQGPAPVASVAP